MDWSQQRLYGGFDYDYLVDTINDCKNNISETSLKATIAPFDHITNFCKDTKSYYSLLNNFENPNYFPSHFTPCSLKNAKLILSLIESLELSIRDRNIISAAPLYSSDETYFSILKLYAQGISDKILIRPMVNIPDLKWNDNTTLLNYENVYQILRLYCWFSEKFPNQFVFVDDVKRKQKIIAEIRLNVNSNGNTLDLMCTSHEEDKSIIDSSSLDLKHAKDSHEQTFRKHLINAKMTQKATKRYWESPYRLRNRAPGRKDVK
ncbi:hypothetical protein ROZALSC1DRAFT_28236 [Rozella allomycis CSF55]|uniref:ATP-dependent RNA helicase SUV3 C-terminal domain-containing protein n=1 Tax=Rozella allomycis (strain CSF55) TaxID=988480 RepID=A0A4P9YM56_ROZAC|nr:hypothetical protein ROZALSC1DRAFT_28236 [Rozella allomycis CSF55]